MFLYLEMKECNAFSKVIENIIPTRQKVAPVASNLHYSLMY